MTRTALITGCSSGIGRETAIAFGKRGWRVYATARDADDVADLADRGLETLALDVTDDDAVERATATVREEAGGVDCLVNNAGQAYVGPVEEFTAEEVRAQFDVNLYGAQRTMRAVLPGMRERGDGTIVNVSSVAGLVSLPGLGLYSGSKHAIEALTDALRAEVAGFGVDAVLVEPGPVGTNVLANKTDRGDEHDDCAYADLHEMLDEATELIWRNDVGPEAVARTIVAAAESDDPDPRYQVNGVAGGSWLRHLPDGVRDRVVTDLPRTLLD